MGVSGVYLRGQDNVPFFSNTKVQFSSLFLHDIFSVTFKRKLPFSLSFGSLAILLGRLATPPPPSRMIGRSRLRWLVIGRSFGIFFLNSPQDEEGDLIGEMNSDVTLKNKNKAEKFLDEVEPCKHV